MKIERTSVMLNTLDFLVGIDFGFDFFSFWLLHYVLLIFKSRSIKFYDITRSFLYKVRFTQIHVWNSCFLTFRILVFSLFLILFCTCPHQNVSQP